MEEADISLLPVHTYTAPGPGASDSSKTDCNVCLSEFKSGEQLRTLPCCHIYHVECIDEWLKVCEIESNCSICMFIMFQSVIYIKKIETLKQNLQLVAKTACLFALDDIKNMLKFTH